MSEITDTQEVEGTPDWMVREIRGQGPEFVAPAPAAQQYNNPDDLSQFAVPAPVAGDAAVVVGHIVHSKNDVSRFEFSEAGMQLGVGRHAVATLAQDRASQARGIGEGDRPARFVALSSAGVVIAADGEPQTVQNAAQDYALAHKGEYVHLYTHAFSVRSSDGD